MRGAATGLLVSLVLSGWAAGCSDDPGAGADAASADGLALEAGASDEGAAPDGGGSADPGGADAGPAAADGLLGDAPDADAATADAWTAPFDPTVCGAAPHAWLPPEAVGGVVTWEPALLAEFTREEVDALLIDAGRPELTPVAHGVRSFRLRYVTQDRGALREATAMVGVPTGLAPADGPAPVGLWLHGTTGLNDACAPSGDPLAAVVAPIFLASAGFFTVAPDYLGLMGFGAPSAPGTLHPYLVGEPTAIASLDAVRAALAAADQDATLVAADAARVGIVGASQGGHAAFFTELYAPHYAPELTVVGVAALVPPADVLGQARFGALTWSATTWGTLAALVAMRRWYGLPDDLTALLTDAPPASLASRFEPLLESECRLDEADFAGLDSVDDVFTAPYLAAMEAEAWPDAAPYACFLQENSAGRTSVPRSSDAPFLAVFGELDELVQTAVERDRVPTLCGQGYRIEVVECAGADHTGGAVAGLPFALRWLRERVDGVAWAQQGLCQLAAPVDCDAL